MTTSQVNPPSLNDSVRESASLVKNFLLADREQPDLAQLINATSVYAGSSSGTRDEDYPSIRLPQLTDVRHTPLPPELIEQFGHMQCNCIVGVFPEIGRAWLTVDSDIFVWRYVDGDDLAYFDGLSETILSAALVKPKPDIFRDHIKYLLVLTTPLEIVLLGVSFAEEDVNSEMHLLPDPLFNIASDNVYLLHTISTESGRIFTAGKDCCLYEIVYQAGGGWFSRKCTKINHTKSKLSFLLPSVVNVWLTEDDSICQIAVDDTRNILYMRTEKGTITVYDLGEDGLSTSCVTQIKMDAIKRRASSIASTVEPSNFGRIVHIAPITKRESRSVHLVAVTHAGIRLYFITTPPASQTVSGMTTTINGSPVLNQVLQVSNQRPTTLTLVHVRLPPGFTPNNLNRPMNVHSAHHNAGTLLLASSNGDDDILWSIGRDYFLFESMITETQITLSLDGRAWYIAEVPEPPSPLAIASLPVGSIDVPPDPPIQVVQHFQRPCEYVIITSKGCHMFNKLRPVDQLRFLLEKTQDPDSEAMSTFFKLNKNGEAASTCIILATSGLPADRVLCELTVSAFFRHGGDAYYVQPGTAPLTLAQASSPAAGNLGAISPIAPGQQRMQETTLYTPGRLPVISTPMPGINAPNFTFQAASPRPMQQIGQTQAASAPQAPELCFSEKFKGLYKMFSRIMRPVWEGRLVRDYIVSEGNRQQTFIVSRLEIEVISRVLDDLNSLKVFMEKYCLPRLPHPGSDSGFTTYAQGTPRSMAQHRLNVTGYHGNALRQDMFRAQQAEAANAEASLVRGLHALTDHTAQVLGVWRLLSHHQLHVLCKTLNKEAVSLLKTITFHEFVMDGSQLCHALLSALVNQYIDDNSAVEALSVQLREVCPSLYSPDDAICSQASELLSKARQSMGSQRKAFVEDSLDLFKQVSHSVNLTLVSQQFQSVNFYAGVIELCAGAANKRDERNLALHYYRSGCLPEENVEGRQAFEWRAECYKCITDMMDELMQASESRPQAPSVPVQPGPPSSSTQGSTLATSSSMKPEESQQYAEMSLQLILKSDDELLHVTLYDWMLRKGLTDKLLKITSPFLESFLKRVTVSRPNDPSSCDIMWQFYERTGNHASAAKFLAKLADKPGSERDLTQRIEYLSRAKINGKSATTHTSANEEGQLLHELEEKLEVAQLQMQILHALEELGEMEAVMRLNLQLMDITKLYSDYAEPYQLAECKLAIVHCAGHYDPSLIEALWQNILEQEMSKICHQSIENQVSTLSLKISQLGKQYIEAQRYFPIEFLVGFLEKFSCERDWPNHWVFLVLLDAGVDISHLVAVYQDLHRMKLSHWASASHPYHLPQVIHKLIATFAENPSRYLLPSQRRKFVTNALDIIAVFLVELQSTVTGSSQLHDTRIRFKNLQAQLERLESQVARKY